MDDSKTLLTIEKLTMRFGGVTALDNVSFTMQPNQILGLIGPNGSGKTTLFNCLSRIYRPNSGKMHLFDNSLLKETKHSIIRLGIARTFQHLALFKSMSVLENVLIGAHVNLKAHFLGDFFRLPSANRDRELRRKEAEEILSFLNLSAFSKHPVVELPFVIQKQVEIARALISKPKLLLLDEPANGLNHSKAEELKKLIQRIRKERNTAILLVEHNMKLVMDVSDRVIALDFGKKIAEDIPSKIQQHPEVINSYLGKR